VHWIEFGGIGRQTDHLKPVGVLILQQPYGLAMDTVSIQHHDELAPQMPMDYGEEPHDVFMADVPVVDLEVGS
jgi:hypothetical protein